MFYTKYRPQTFSEISRPNDAADALANQISTGKTVHAYLFVGPRGTGKTSTARILAKALNCSNLSKNGDPCDTCDMCLAVKNGSLPDLIEIDAASNRGIDDIRSLQDQINLAPSYGKHKVYIIDEVHMLTSQAFNALLKTLEEPPKNVTFILCTTELHKVPDTIKSRCQVFRFKRATVPQLVTKLKFIAESEGHTVEDTFLSRVASASLGGFRDAETLLQQMLEGGIDINSSDFSSFDKGTLLEFVDLLRNKETNEALRVVTSLYDSGIDLGVWSQELVSYFRDVLLLNSGFSKESFDMSDSMLKSFIQHANILNTNWLIFCIDKFIEAGDKVKKSFIPQLPLEIAVIEICNLDNSLEISSNKNVKGPLVPNNNTIVNGKTPIGGSVSNKPTAPKTNSDIDIAIDKNKVKDKAPSKESRSVKSLETSSINIELIDDASVAIDISMIESRWEEFLNRMKDVNGAILAMLKSTKLTGSKGRFLILDVYFSFHKERLEHSKNREIIDRVLYEVFNIPISIACHVSTEKPQKLKDREVGVLTDVNVVPVDTGELMNVFDGGLPL